MKRFSLKVVSLLILICLMPNGLVLAQSNERTYVVEYMKKMATVQWVPMKDMEYWNLKYGVLFKEGQTYKGIPYTQKQRNTDYELFLKHLENTNGIDFYRGPSEALEYLGSDCSSAVSMSWRQIDAEFPITDTYTMLLALGAIVSPVGDYKINSHLSTKSIVEKNGRDVIFSAYSKLQPGDAVLKNGHIMMVSQVDHKNNKIHIIDQTGATDLPFPVLKGSNGESTWRVNKEFTYDDLLSENFIPITINVLLASDEKADKIEELNFAEIDLAKVS